MTSSNIESCLSEIKAEQEKRDFLRLMLKLDIRIGFVKGDKGNYYKIWIIRKDNKKKVYIKDHYHKAGSAIAQPTLQDILDTIREIVDVPKSYKKYCSVWFPKPDKDEYLDALSRANRFKDVLNREDIKSIVASLSIKRLPDAEIQDEIFKQTDKTVSRTSLYRIRQSIKRQSFQWYKTMREGEYEYIHEFKERINEILFLQKQHHQIIDSAPEPTTVKQASLAELHKLNITLSNYFDVAPSIVNGNTLSAAPQTKATITEPERGFIV